MKLHKAGDEILKMAVLPFVVIVFGLLIILAYLAFTKEPKIMIAGIWFVLILSTSWSIAAVHHHRKRRYDEREEYAQRIRELEANLVQMARGVPAAIPAPEPTKSKVKDLGTYVPTEMMHPEDVMRELTKQRPFLNEHQVRHLLKNPVYSQHKKVKSALLNWLKMWERNGKRKHPAEATIAQIEGDNAPSPIVNFSA